MNQVAPNFPFTIDLPASYFPAPIFSGLITHIHVPSGLITLLGANGSGKTKTMKALRDHLRSVYGAHFVRFVSAGRMGVIEDYRSNARGNSQGDGDNTYIGDHFNIKMRKQAESVVGDFQAIDSRSDIRLKVQARLQGLFGKVIQTTWTQNGLKVDFRDKKAGSVSYGAGNEASGLMQLVALLASLYDDEIKFLLIDEPEVSLHPQLQSFLLKEIQQVAGDPNVDGKKLVFISTHSPAMLTLKKVADLPSVIFFKKTKELPVQIESSNPILLDTSLKSLIPRLGEIYKIGFFANKILLSEGVSDEIVVSTIADIVNANFSSTGIQLVPVSGKNEIISGYKLFSAIGKEVCVIADLDVLDDSKIIKFIDSTFLINAEVSALGYTDIESLYNEVFTEVTNLVTNHWADVALNIATQGYWRQTGLALGLKKYRTALSYLATASASQIGTLNNTSMWQSTSDKLVSLLDLLEKHNLFLIRRGSIEDCFLNPHLPPNETKPITASLEADYLLSTATGTIQTSYSDIIRAIEAVRILPKINEAALLREKLGSVIGAIDANYTKETTDDDVLAVMEAVDKDITTLFEINTKTDGTKYWLEINNKSQLFSSHPSMIIHEMGSVTDLSTKIPS